MVDKKKDGLTVRELTELGNKYRIEVFMCLLLVLTCIFNFIFIGGALSILTGVIGGIVGILSSAKLEHYLKAMIQYPLEQSTTTQLIIAGAVLLVGIFLPLVIFLFLGLYAGHVVYKFATSK